MVLTPRVRVLLPYSLCPPPARNIHSGSVPCNRPASVAKTFESDVKPLLRASQNNAGAATIRLIGLLQSESPRARPRAKNQTPAAFLFAMKVINHRPAAEY